MLQVAKGVNFFGQTKNWIAISAATNIFVTAQKLNGKYPLLRHKVLWTGSTCKTRDRSFYNFIELGCQVASGGLHFCVSLTSFQKYDIGWLQQPPTEKVLKFNWYFMILPKQIVFFSKNKNKAEFKFNFQTCW